MEKTLQIMLVKRAKNGDAAAFIKLCESYEEVLYNSAYKLLQNNEDVVDCIQETEIIAWKKISNLKNETAFNTWFFKIMINSAKKILRKKDKVIEFNDSYGNYEEKVHEKLHMNEMLHKLPEIYLIPIVLYYYVGFTITEIAYQLDVPQNTVKTRLSRGRQKLKCLLED
ncbi:RNA polymerase sigma factor [Candidatus Enterococcus clewellii]|uniref:RNA polymerase sigma-70 factor, ECF subfamily n=1 Tax=Candidatus Enterococcus clewellii TaxID=1834193 RepID=A0AAQ3VRX4_9ENTE